MRVGICEGFILTEEALLTTYWEVVRTSEVLFCGNYSFMKKLIQKKNYHHLFYFLLSSNLPSQQQNSSKTFLRFPYFRQQNINSNSMRRKTLEHSLPYIRPAKKYKTEITDRKKTAPFPFPTHTSPHSLTSQIIADILASVQVQIHTLNIYSCAVQMIKQVGESVFLLEESCCPQDHETSFQIIEMDYQPERVEFDPICGFNKLVTKQKKREYDLTLKEKRKQTIQIPTLLSIRKKSIEKIENDSEDKLVPLNKFSTQKQKEEYQSMLRQRIIYETRNLLRPTIIIPKKNDIYDKRKGHRTQKFGESLQKNSNEEYVYGYKGEKELLNLSLGKNLNSGFGGNSIIKTTYRINNDIIQKNDKQVDEKEVLKMKNREQGTKPKRNASRKGYQKSSKIIRFIAQASSQNQSQIKSLLESEFKRTQKSNVKWKEKLERLPQQRFSKMF